MSDKPTLQERYASAAEASSLTLRETQGPVDVLMAAGLAAQDNVLRGAALALFRMRESGKTGQFTDVVEVLTDWLTRAVQRNRLAGRGAMKKKRMVARLVFWWLNPTCPHCHGRGHPVRPGTPVIDESRVCPECHGTGKVPIERAVQPEQIEMARMLAAALESATTALFADAARKLR